MKRVVAAYVSIERRLDAESPWTEISRYAEDVSIEQARKHMGMIEPVLPTAEHRLTYTRVEETKEILD